MGATGGKGCKLFGCNEQLGVGRSHVAGGAREAEGANTDQIQLAGTIELKIAVDQQAIRCQLGDTGTLTTLKAIVRTSSAAQQGVRAVHHSAHASGAIAPGHGTEPRAVTAARAPVRAEHQIVTVAQLTNKIGRNRITPHVVIGIAAHQRVCTAHLTAHPAEAVAPGHRAAESIPSTAHNHIVAIVQGQNLAAAHAVTRCAAHQRISAAHHAAHASKAVAPSHSTKAARARTV